MHKPSPSNPTPRILKLRHRQKATLLTALLLTALLLTTLLLSTLLAALQTSAQAATVHDLSGATAERAQRSLVVGFDRQTAARDGRVSVARSNVGSVAVVGPHSAVVRVKRSLSLQQAAARIARRSGVSFVKPNYLARISEEPAEPPVWLPNDPGRSGKRGGWQRLQWNFVGPWGVNAPAAWARMRKLQRSGGRGVVVAVIDTGVAFENRGRYRRSPDLRGVKIKSPWNFIGRNKHPVDTNGHGTHVASTIFERTGNGVGVTGLAYGATMMPIRALNSKGYGDEVTVARAIRYAADRRASVINLSVEFDVSLVASDLPTITSALRYAKRKGSLVVAAAGNQASGSVAYPARSSHVLAVGATTVNGCLADYSDFGPGLNLVAPGGGADTPRPDRSATSSDRDNCAFGNPARSIYQMTFVKNPRKFSLPSTYQGTSMAAPHVSATAALVIASRVIGKRPTPAALQLRLEQTATDLGVPGPDLRYGNGLVNAARAVGAY